MCAATAAKLQKQAGLHGIDVQPQDRLVVGGGVAPALISYNVTCFGPSVEGNHQSVCAELQRPWQEDKEYPAMRAAMEAARIRALPGGADDKQLAADGGPEADGAAQRVAKQREYQSYSKHIAMEAGGAEQLLAAVITLSPAKLAAKSCSYVAAALSAGGAEQLVAAATTLSRAELVDKSYMYLCAMARASERFDGANGVTDGICKGFEGSTKQVLADYIVKTRQIRQGELLANQQGRLGALLVKQQGEIQLLLASFSLSKVGL